MIHTSPLPMGFMAKILIAANQETVDRLTPVLSPKHEVVIANSLVDATTILAQSNNIDLIVCGMHFDDFRMLDLLSAVKADHSHKNVPFICFRQSLSGLPANMTRSIEVAAQAVGASCCIDASAAGKISDADLLDLIEAQLSTRATAFGN